MTRSFLHKDAIIILKPRTGNEDKGVAQRRVSTIKWWRYEIGSLKTTLKFW